ncbi:trans-AT polyketide synthase/acyltransferase/oxidoreductase domain-containing protein [Actinopolyspora lacussalsi]|nr:trans-AT polyketide synthase/acyltransferase/oxidoreductase domain-containing protein [Actinopolyspora lacussalsi]
MPTTSAAAWVFPGQGAQHLGMAADLPERFPTEWAEAERVLDLPLRELCTEGPAERLRRTENAQPAIYLVECLTFLANRSVEPPPEMVAGHSVGEFAALFAAGCMDLATGLRLVRRRGELMSRAGGGGMLAVLRIRVDELRELLAGLGLTDELDIANHNGVDQIVLSGPETALDSVAEAVRADGRGRSSRLNVSAPFHSRWMAEAARDFREYLGGFSFQDPGISVVAGSEARIYESAADVADVLSRQITDPVRWLDVMELFVERGVDRLVELGPGRVLSGLWRSHEPGSAAGRPDSAPSARTVRPGRASAAGTSEGAAEPGTTVTASGRLRPEELGSPEFRRAHGVRYAYVAGSMYRGIASAELVSRMSRAGLLSYLGTGGCDLAEVEKALAELCEDPVADRPFGVNLLASPQSPDRERELVELCLRHGVTRIEAAAFTGVTPAVVRFRYSGAHRTDDGTPVAVRHVMAKVSRPEVAEEFLAPAPPEIVKSLVERGELSAAEAAVARVLPLADDLCVEADSAGHTDGRAASALFPTMARLRDSAAERYGAGARLGAAGGLGTPEALAAAFVMGADFVLTGSVNQCTPEAGTSEEVKDMLASLDVQDTTYAPAGDMFELGARVQVAQRGTLFGPRADRLYRLYRQHGSLEELDRRTAETIQRNWFKLSFEEVWDQTRDYLAAVRPHELESAERDPHHRMARVFRWWFARTNRLAITGESAERVNFQIHCGQAMGAFNRFAADAGMADRRQRHVDEVAELLMTSAAELLDRRITVLRPAASG